MLKDNEASLVNCSSSEINHCWPTNHQMTTIRSAENM